MQPYKLFEIPERQSEQLESSDLPDFNVTSSMMQRKDYDFTEVLWDYCKNAASIDDLTNVLMSVMDGLEDLSLQPIIHKSNHTALGEICRDCLKLSRIQTSLDAVTAKERISESCDYWSSNVLECMVEIGLYKLRRDWKYWCNQVLMGLDVEDLLDNSLPLSDQIEVLRRLSCVVMLWEAVKLNLASLPSDSMRDLLIAMLNHFKSNDANNQDSKAMTCPVEFGVEIAPYSGVVKNIFMG